MKLHALAAALLMTTMHAAAQTPVALAPFHRVELHGGGRVVLRHGAAQQVTLVRGNTETTRLRVENGTLIVDACVRSCHAYDLAIDIVVPHVDAVSAQGGGAIRAEPGFGAEALAASVSGGGSIDLRAIPAGTVAAAVHGGGNISTRVRDSLTASVSGGGSIRYWGDPRVTQAVHGGGSVQRGG